MKKNSFGHTLVGMVVVVVVVVVLGLDLAVLTGGVGGTKAEGLFKVLAF